MAYELSPQRSFRELSTLRDEIDRIWSRFFGEQGPLVPWRGEWAPSLDVSETKNSIIVKAELPGMDAKDLDISLTDDVLTVKGEKKQEKEEEDENYHRIERSYGSFSRSVRLPSEVQSDKIEANYKNGILKIALPKSEKAKSKEVKIKVQ
jgi:HSP20 family protein